MWPVQYDFDQGNTTSGREIAETAKPQPFGAGSVEPSSGGLSPPKPLFGCVVTVLGSGLGNRHIIWWLGYGRLVRM